MWNLWNVDLLDVWKVSEKSEWVSEEDIWRVLENLKKAKQVRQQIQRVKKEDWKVATVLEFLVKNIDSQLILKLILNLYEEDRKNVYFVFYILFPFLKDKVQNEILLSVVDKVWLKEENIDLNFSSISEYIEFVKQIYKKSKGIEIKKDILVELLMWILVNYKVGVIANLKFTNNKQKEEFLTELHSGIQKEIEDIL